MRPLWNAEDLLNATGGRLVSRFAATGVSIDTRTLKPGDLFVALVGDSGDGHDHVAAAIAAGAAGALVHRAVPGVEKLLLTDDTMAALVRLGAFARQRFAGALAAITGSVGKTTTKEMLRTILAAQAGTHAAVASYNNHWGVPLTLARMPPDAVHAVVEIGMNHAGEIEPLARLAEPHVAVITAIAKNHVGYLGSLDAIAAEKATLLRGLLPGGTAVLPADGPFLTQMEAAAGDARVLRFGRSESAEARLMTVTSEASGSYLEIRLLGQDVRLWLNAPGSHMAMNAAAALAAAMALGADPIRSAEALEKFTPISGRGARWCLKLEGGTALLLDESYNASGASVRAALDVLGLQPARRRIAVLGDMLELGDIGPAEHAGLAPDVDRAADLVFTCGSLTRHLFAAIPAAKRGAHADTAADLAPIVAGVLRSGDVVLVKGSLGSRMRDVVGAIEALADEAALAGHG